MVGIFRKTEVIGSLHYVRSAVENAGSSVVDIFCKTEVMGKLYYVRPTDENMGGSVVDVFGKQEYLASCTMHGPLTKPWVVRWLI